MKSDSQIQKGLGDEKIKDTLVRYLQWHVKTNQGYSSWVIEQQKHVYAFRLTLPKFYDQEHAAIR